MKRKIADIYNLCEWENPPAIYNHNWYCLSQNEEFIIFYCYIVEYTAYNMMRNAELSSVVIPFHSIFMHFSFPNVDLKSQFSTLVDVRSLFLRVGIKF